MQSLKYKNNQIGFYLWLRTILDDRKEVFVPISDLPTEIQTWGNPPENNGFTLSSLCFPCDSVDSAVSKKLPCCLNIIFNETATNTKFAYEFPSLAKNR